jgi:inner membrane protein
MSSLFGHALAGLATSAAFSQGRPPRRLWLAATACAVAPDLDWFVEFLNLSQRSDLLHRGLSHSVLAAGIIAAAGMGLAFRDQMRHPRLWGCLLVAALSHGLLDAFTFGGKGVPLLLPFTEARFVGAWQPLLVSPIPLSRRLLDWLVLSLGTEAFWIGLPTLALFLVPRAAGWFGRPRPVPAPSGVEDQAEAEGA